MRDPRNIARPRLYPESNPGFLTTRGWGRIAPVHMHTAYPDMNGNGFTSMEVSHFHRIVNGRIMPDESDSHEHTITNIPNGAGV